MIYTEPFEKIVILDSNTYKCVELTSYDGIDFDLLFTTGVNVSLGIRVFSGVDTRVDLNLNSLSRNELDIFATYKKDEISLFCLELQNKFNWLGSDEEWISVISKILKGISGNRDSIIKSVRRKYANRQRQAKSTKLNQYGNLSNYW
jgi:hypothetical protein